MSKKKRFRKHEKEQMYRVAKYSLDTVEKELDKATSSFTNCIDSLLGLHSKGMSDEHRYLLSNAVKALHAHYQLYLLPYKTLIRVERTMDLKMYAGLFPWHRPISDQYIREQFFLASKECFEMELANLRSMTEGFMKSYNGTITKIANKIKARA